MCLRSLFILVVLFFEWLCWEMGVDLCGWRQMCAAVRCFVLLCAGGVVGEDCFGLKETSICMENEVCALW